MGKRRSRGRRKVKFRKAAGTARRREKSDADEEEVADVGIDTRIETTQSCSAKTEPIRAGEIKKGMTVMLKGFPCKVIEVTTSKTGKHGHAKANITGLDIFTGKKYMDISPTSHNMTKPVVTTATYSIMDIAHGGELTLMDEGGTTKEDLNLPADTDLANRIQEAFTKGQSDGTEVLVIVTSAMDKEQITDVKTTG